MLQIPPSRDALVDGALVSQRWLTWLKDLRQHVIDEDTALAARVTTLEAQQVATDTALAALEARVDAIEAALADLAAPFTDVPYADAVFSASTGTWTVDAADYITFTWKKQGAKATVLLRIHASSLSAGPNGLSVNLPAALVPAKSVGGSFHYLDTFAIAGTGNWQISAAGTVLSLFRDANATAWVTNTGETFVYVVAVFEVVP